MKAFPLKVKFIFLSQVMFSVHPVLQVILLGITKFTSQIRYNVEFFKDNSSLGAKSYFLSAWALAD